MGATTEIAALGTSEAANQIAEILRANGIECSVESTWMSDRMSNTALPNMGSNANPLRGQQIDYRVFVAKEDEQKARDALQGVFASHWFLRTADGRPYHSFEAATVDVLRAHVANHADGQEFGRLDISYIAGVMEQHGWHTVYQVFHEGHLRHHDRPLDGRSLDDWARACGCAHHHTKPDP